MPQVGEKSTIIPRFQRVYEFWAKDLFLKDIDAIYICYDKGEGQSYSKTSVFHEYLFGIDLTDSILLLTKEHICFYGSQRKVNFLNCMEDITFKDVQFIVQDKKTQSEDFKTMLGFIKKNKGGSKVGSFLKDKFSTPSFPEFSQLLQNSSFQLIDISNILSTFLYEKSVDECQCIKTASMITCNIYNKFLKGKILEMIEANKKVKHSQFSELIENCIENQKYIPEGINSDDIEICFPVICQSGGNYNVKFSTESNSDKIKFDLLIFMIGMRYKYYCSCLIRTMMINPTEEQKYYYEVAVLLFDVIINSIKPGVSVNKVYQIGVEFLKDKDKKLVNYIPNNFGFSTGIEFKDNQNFISENNEKKFLPNSTFCVMILFQNLPKDEKLDKMAICIADTIKVNDTGVEILTASSKRQLGSVTIKVDDSKESKESRNKDAFSEDSLEVLNDDITDTTKYGRHKRNKQAEIKNNDKMKIHQKTLLEQLNSESKSRLTSDSKQKSNTISIEPKKNLTNIMCYRNNNDIPQDRDISQMRIFVDKVNDCFILPIFGQPLVVHISMVKNISTSIESDYMYLRINFNFPIQFNLDSYENKSSMKVCLKEVVMRSLNIKEIGQNVADSAHIVTVFRLVKDMQKRFKNSQAEEKELQGIVQQPDLRLNPNRQVPRLRNLLVRPAFSARRVVGTLESHVNGFRYTTEKGHKVDILYSNIQASFFQPCDNDVIVLIHFHLKNPILFEKKRFSDVQFYSEVGVAVSELDKTGSMYHMNDQDEYEAEQAELEVRQQINQSFKTFCDAVEAQTEGKIEFDMPFKELGFYGVPSRVSVFLTPTTHCLMNLSEIPFFILFLDQIDFVNFERVQFNTKHFDMVFVFKDYRRKVVMISCIPMPDIDSIKEWLDSCDIKFFEGLQSLNWPKIMKTVVEDPHDFFKNGGWNFLEIESDSDNLENQGDLDESKSEDYKPSESEEYEEDDDDDELDEEFEDDDDIEESEDFSDALSWDELEELAIKEDIERNSGKINKRTKPTLNHPNKKSKH